MKWITFFAVFLSGFLAVPLVSSAADVGVNIGIPVPLEFSAEPDVEVVPSGDSYVYMVPGTPGLFFYDNYWYRSYNGHWYRSDAYNGSWVYVEGAFVPRVVVDVSPDYYSRLPRWRHHRIHYRDFHRHWRDWGRDRHWHRRDGGRRDGFRRDGIRRGGGGRDGIRRGGGGRGGRRDGIRRGGGGRGGGGRDGVRRGGGRRDGGGRDGGRRR